MYIKGLKQVDALTNLVNCFFFFFFFDNKDESTGNASVCHLDELLANIDNKPPLLPKIPGCPVR